MHKILLEGWKAVGLGTVEGGENLWWLYFFWRDRVGLRNSPVVGLRQLNQKKRTLQKIEIKKNATEWSGVPGRAAAQGWLQ